MPDSGTQADPALDEQLAELTSRLLRAHANLTALIQSASDRTERTRLEGKASGVILALNYVSEARR